MTPQKQSPWSFWDNERWGLWTWSGDCPTAHPTACSKEEQIRVQAGMGVPGSLGVFTVKAWLHLSFHDGVAFMSCNTQPPQPSRPH